MDRSVVPLMASLQLLTLAKLSRTLVIGENRNYFTFLCLCFTCILQLHLPSLMYWSSRTGITFIYTVLQRGDDGIRVRLGAPKSV